ncbi:iron-sulfur cluster assembly accessory protein [Nitritalea halalkaliphila LW7]|uniref:Iron-sulfur cluster assembly accessory protein n=1 Tax=Nitritalea halalkaliphila LW7 TaxID=1189621 RepID=I5C514_9BACT|nr:iron-sulfur cluster assembly accessory protein [Nitritalea halalkaliphila]EIM76916.1 iron-sulfur cluster assembly accessory protein [Nitritalea halalkaliphila LW7]
MIIVSDKAKEQILTLKREENRAEHENIRVSVKGGGCSGLMYDLHFDDKTEESDHIFEDKGVKIIVDRKSLLYLAGTTLEFSDGLNGKGFQFVNPNASRTCGCGESFSI